MMKPGSVIEKAIERLAPTWAAQRAIGRLRLEQARIAHGALRSFEAASISPRTEGWTTTGAGPNSVLSGSLGALQARGRDLKRNNPYARKAIGVYRTMMVGQGVHPHHDEDSAQREDLWEEWVEAVGFYRIQAKIVEECAEVGECLVRPVFDPEAPGPIPLRLQVLGAEFLDHSKDTTGSDGKAAIRQGVETDSWGFPVAYWLHTEHPGDSRSGYGDSRRVPAEDIAHIYWEDVVGQLRGVPWGTASFVRLRDTKDAVDATVIRHQIAQCFAIFVRDIDGNGLGNISPSESANRAKSDGRNLPISPGMITSLPPGKSIEIAKPPAVEGIRDLFSISLHECAVGFEVPYELMTGELRDVSFISGRLGIQQFYELVDQRLSMMLSPQLTKIYRWFELAAGLAGKLSTSSRVEWLHPGRPALEPAKDVPARQQQVRNGFRTLGSVAVATSGKPLRRIIDTLKKEKAMAEEAGLNLDVFAGDGGAEPADPARNDQPEPTSG